MAFLSGVCEANALDHELFDLNIHIRNSLGEELWNQAYTIFSSLDYVENRAVLDQIDLAIESGVELVLAQSADIIAITVFSYQQIAITKLFLANLRAKSDVQVIAGGPGVSYEVNTTVTAGKQLLELGLIDYYVLGEGEYTLDQFFKGHIELGVNYTGAPESWAVQIDNLDDCILPTYKKINFDNYSPGIEI